MIKKERIITRKQDFAKWYSSIVTNAELALYCSLKGTIIFQPNAWMIWENIQHYINLEFRKLGIKNVALPTLIPMVDLAKEKEHVEGFAPELFIVSKIGDKELSEQYVLRPTSEILFCQYFKNIVSSYKNLPIKLNQWCSVYRAEKTTKPFLRNSEFYWQEMHSIHQNPEDAYNFATTLINLYEKFMNDILCIPVIKGEKTIGERFAGANNTFTVEGLMQDGQMLQCGTSHYLATNFSSVYDIKFQDKNNIFQYVHQVSAGISTRLLGAIIMVHGDDHGLVLPFQIAPIQVAICLVGLSTNNKNHQDLIDSIVKEVKNYRYEINDSDKSLGYKLSQYEICGVPIQIIIGKETINNNEICIIKRNTLQKIQLPLSKFNEQYLAQLLNEINCEMYQKAKNHLNDSIVKINNVDELKDAVKKGKIAIAYWAGSKEDEKKLKEITSGISPRCIYQITNEQKNCFYTNKKTNQVVLFARSY